MHSLLRTLPPKQKPRWPVHLPELVQACNNTPHASHPNSCSLNRSPDCRWTTCWDVLLPLQRGQLTGWLEAHHKAFYQLKQAAAKMARYTDKVAADHALQVGDHFYLLKRVLGRNKIRDFWRPELPQVTSRTFDNHAYMTQTLAGGSECAVHRKDICRPFVVDAYQQSPSPSPSVILSQTVTTNCAFCHRLQNPAVAAVPPVPPVALPVPLPRRSRRLAEKNINRQ